VNSVTHGATRAISVIPRVDRSKHGCHVRCLVHKAGFAAEAKCPILSGGFRKPQWSVGYSL